MQRFDIANGLGSFLSYVKFTITYSDLAAFTTAGAKTISLLADPGGNNVNAPAFNLPQGGTFLFSRTNCTAGFTGGSLSAVTLSVGISGTATCVTAANSIFATGTFDKHGMNSELNSNAAVPIILTLTPTGDVLGNATAGSVDIYLCYLNTSTPSA